MISMDGKLSKIEKITVLESCKKCKHPKVSHWENKGYCKTKDCNCVGYQSEGVVEKETATTIQKVPKKKTDWLRWCFWFVGGFAGAFLFYLVIGGGSGNGATGFIVGAGAGEVIYRVVK